MNENQSNVTRLLQSAGEGNSQAVEDLLPIVYGELRRLAGAQMRNASPNQTLQPTALVHEALLRLVGRDNGLNFENRKHFFFAASRAMHDLLVERARAKSRKKRGGDRRKVSIEDLAVAAETQPDDLLALDEVLQELGREHPRALQMVQLRFFVGLTEQQAAEVLELPLRSAQREWRFTRAWLQERLS